MKRVRESLPITDPNLKQALMEYGHAINGLKSLFKEDVDGNEYLDKIRNADGDTYVEVIDEDVIHFYRAGNEIGQFNNNGLNLAVGKGLVDADGDTYVTVEETADENVIRFYTAGSESIRILSNGKLYTGGEAIEINTLNSGDRNSYIDFHSDDTNTDYSARIRRYPGANGNLEIENVGTGEIHFITNGSERVIIDNGKTTIYGQLQINRANHQIALYDTDVSAVKWTITTYSNTDLSLYYEGTTQRFRFGSDGKAYADDSWNTFSPVLPDVKRYDWVEVAKEDAYKPRKPDDLTMDKITEEDIEKYGKDIAKIAMANTRAIDYIAHVQRCILRSLINTRRMLYDIRQSTTKKSIN